MSKIAAIQKLNNRELELGIAGTSASWHEQYHDNPTVYVGGLAASVDEQVILSIFEQYGTLVHVNLVRDSSTGASRGFAFAQYADARSAVLAVDNLNGYEHDGRMLRVDHVADYANKDADGAMDTTPVQAVQHAANAAALCGASTRGEHASSTERQDAEICREQAVMERLRALRKRRRAHPPPSAALRVEAGPRVEDGDGRVDRHVRRGEKEKRRMQRDAIRKARAQRRGERDAGR